MFSIPARLLSWMVALSNVWAGDRQLGCHDSQGLRNVHSSKEHQSWTTWLAGWELASYSAWWHLRCSIAKTSCPSRSSIMEQEFGKTKCSMMRNVATHTRTSNRSQTSTGLTKCLKNSIPSSQPSISQWVRHHHPPMRLLSPPTGTPTSLDHPSNASSHPHSP